MDANTTGIIITAIVAGVVLILAGVALVLDAVHRATKTATGNTEEYLRSINKDVDDLRYRIADVRNRLEKMENNDEN